MMPESILNGVALDSSVQEVLTSSQAILAQLQTSIAVSGTVSLNSEQITALQSVTAAVSNWPTDYPDAETKAAVNTVNATLGTLYTLISSGISASDSGTHTALGSILTELETIQATLTGSLTVTGAVSVTGTAAVSDATTHTDLAAIESTLVGTLATSDAATHTDLAQLHTDLTSVESTLSGTLSTSDAATHTDLAQLHTDNQAIESALGGTITVSDGTTHSDLSAIETALGAPAQDGTDGTGITPPTGGAGIRGWLSGNYSKLSSILTAITGLLTTNVTQIGSAAISQGVKVSASSVPVVLASDDAQIGVKTTAATMPTGGSGLLGWLSAIATYLASTLTIQPANTATSRYAPGGSQYMLSTTNLAASASFTSSSQDAWGVASGAQFTGAAIGARYVGFAAWADQTLSLTIYGSNNGTTFEQVAATTNSTVLGSINYVQQSVDPMFRYWQVVVKNTGSATTTTFTVNAKYLN